MFGSTILWLKALKKISTKHLNDSPIFINFRNISVLSKEISPQLFVQSNEILRRILPNSCHFIICDQLKALGIEKYLSSRTTFMVDINFFQIIPVWEWPNKLRG